MVAVEVAAGGEDGEQTAEYRAEEAFVLVAFFEYLGAQTAFLGGHTQNLLVEVGHAEVVGQPVPDGTSAAAELSAYVDDEFFYLHNSIGFKQVVYGICALE